MAQILVVDDSSTVRNEVVSFLTGMGYQVSQAADGQQGLNCVQRDPDLKLIICDVNMPNVDGLTMVERIRSEANNRTVNVIMLTTESDPLMKARGKAAGIKGWIVKPFNGEGVAKNIRQLVS